MNGYNLSIVCAYIDDFIKTISNEKKKFNLKNYVEDRFEKYSKETKSNIYNVFNNFLINLKENLDDNINIKDLSKDLLEVLKDI